MSGSRSCWCFMAVFFYIEIYPIVSSYLTALVCSIRSLRRSGRRRPRLPMRGGSNWPSCVSRLRKQPRRSWDLSWRFLPRSSTEKLCFLSVLWNIWSIVLSSLVKVCDSIILSDKPCYPSVTPILNTFSSRWMNCLVYQMYGSHSHSGRLEVSCVADSHYHMLP